MPATFNAYLDCACLMSVWVCLLEQHTCLVKCVCPVNGRDQHTCLFGVDSLGYVPVYMAVAAASSLFTLCLVLRRGWHQHLLVWGATGGWGSDIMSLPPLLKMVGASSLFTSWVHVCAMNNTLVLLLSLKCLAVWCSVVGRPQYPNAILVVRPALGVNNHTTLTQLFVSF